MGTGVQPGTLQALGVAVSPCLHSPGSSHQPLAAVTTQAHRTLCLEPRTHHPRNQVSDKIEKVLFVHLDCCSVYERQCQDGCQCGNLLTSASRRMIEKLQQQLSQQEEAHQRQLASLAAAGGAAADEARRVEVESSAARAEEADRRAAAAEEQAARLQTLLRRASTRHVSSGAKVTLACSPETLEEQSCFEVCKQIN